MPFKRTTLRYAHTNGHTHCTYTEDGSTIITCGSDGDMRTWQGIDDDDPTSKCLGELIISIVHYDKRILVSTDLNTVQAYNFPDITRDGTEFRFTAPANCIAVNNDYIAAGSEDTEIKLTKKDKSIEEFSLQGHSGPVLAIDLSVKDILASISGDGTLKIWNLNEKKEIKTLEGFPKVRTLEEVKLYGTPSFEPKNGNSLAFCKEKEIVILNMSTFETQFVLTDDKVTSDYSCCKFSNDGQYIVAGTRNGEISVWNFITRQRVAGETTSSDCQSITSIFWNPKNNGEVAYCDSTGQLGTVYGCMEGKSEKVKNKEKVSEFLNDEAEDDDPMDGYEFENDDDDGLPGGEFGDLDDDGVSLEKLKNETMKANGILDDDKNEDDRDVDTKSVSSIGESDRMGGGYVKTFKQQEPFQPGAAPEDLENRYLVWNNVGIVRSITNEGENSIHIEFHDVTTHHALHINNYWNHNMAALSSTVLALGSFNGNKLVCILLGGIGSREWSVDLPNCEGIQAITATDNIVAIATDNRMLRIFTATGTQREVISLPGPVVSMCGRDNKLLVAYHNAPATEDQHISAMFIQFIGPTLKSKDIRIPITPEKKLTWMGFSDQGSPVSSDTMGFVQMYSTKTGCWYPICDTMKHAQSVSNNFYLIEVLESSQQIQAVLCRGSTYPTTTPRPMVSEIQMEVPLCSLDIQKSKFEENLIRMHNFNVENAEKNIKEIALKLFALACHAELERRAKELIEMLGSTSILQMAIKYAASIGRIHLADRLTEMRGTVEEQEKQKEKEETEKEMEAFNILQSSSLSLLTSANALKSNNNTPKTVITPKPMVLSTKRNPFKRSSGTPTSSVTEKKSQLQNSLSSSNPLSHLTEKALGLELKRDKTLQQSSEGTDFSTQNSLSSELEEIPPTENNENKAKNDGAPPMNFMAWFNMNREELRKSNTDASDSDLAKIGMKEYKKTTSTSVTKDFNSNKFGKRKLNGDGVAADEKQSGIAKLAKFTFKT